MNMTPKVITHCVDCRHDQRIDRGYVTLRHCATDDTYAYTFRCPECGYRNNKPCCERTASLLVRYGVHVERWTLPDELGEPHPCAAPFVLDDVLDWHVALEDATLTVEAFVR